MFKPARQFSIGDRVIDSSAPSYFIADIGANHDGDLSRALDLIQLAADAGADAAKFQHFAAATIVSDRGFRTLGSAQSHQSTWKKSVFEVYQGASINLEWTRLLKEKCDEVGIHFLSSPYAFEMVDHLDPYVPAYKVGSGDITWHDIIRHMARCKKPLLLACGASSMDEVQAAMKVALEETAQVCLMQCNTNYTGNIDNLHHVNLNVLSTFRAMYPEAILGLSDHTPGHATVLGAIALGARVIEKHFTDDTNREGPDHHFAMDPQTWREMVDRSRELEAALGDGQKRIEVNEQETVVVQRRSLRLKRDLVAGQTIRSDDLIALRPCPSDALPPSVIERVLGMTLNENKAEGEHLTWRDLV